MEYPSRRHCQRQRHLLRPHDNCVVPEMAPKPQPNDRRRPPELLF